MHDYRRILALIDLSKEGAAVARRALHLARLGGAELVFLHLVEHDPVLDGGYPPPGRDVERSAYEQAALRRLKFLADGLDAKEAVLQARFGQAAQGFADCIADWQPDLVVVAQDPGYLSGRHDLLTLGRASAGGGRLVRLLRDLLLPFRTGFAG
jgi:nucleotide-binding universal stress UspA family protein